MALTASVLLLYEVLPLRKLRVVEQQDVGHLPPGDVEVVLGAGVVQEDLHGKQRLHVVRETELLEEKREGHLGSIGYFANFMDS